MRKNTNKRTIRRRKIKRKRTLRRRKIILKGGTLDDIINKVVRPNIMNINANGISQYSLFTKDAIHHAKVDYNTSEDDKRYSEIQTLYVNRNLFMRENYTEICNLLYIYCTDSHVFGSPGAQLFQGLKIEQKLQEPNYIILISKIQALIETINQTPPMYRLMIENKIVEQEGITAFFGDERKPQPCIKAYILLQLLLYSYIEYNKILYPKFGW